MPNIDIRQQHKLDHQHARATVTRIAAELAGKIGTQSSWCGDTLHFNRPGVSGSIELHHDHVRVVVQLGLVLSTLKPVIHREVTRLLQEHFGC